MSLTKYEQETIITSNDADEYVRIWTAQRRAITQLTRDDRFILDRQGDHEGSEWVEGRVHKSDWRPLGGFKKQVSESQRENGKRLAAKHGFQAPKK